MTTGTHQRDEAEGRTWRGSTALGLVVFFLAGTFASAAGMHGCPRHHHAPSPDAVAAGGGSGAAGTASDRGRDGEEPPGTSCTCLGDCQSGAPSALHEPPVRSMPDAEPRVRAVAGHAAELRSEPRSEYFLPYPLGPPVA